MLIFTFLLLQESNAKDEISHCASFSLHDWPATGVQEVLKMQSQRRWRLPVKLTPSCKNDKPGGYAKPDEILGRTLIGHGYGYSKSSSGFENAHYGWRQGYKVCSSTEDLVKAAVDGWLNSPPHRATMLNEVGPNGDWTDMTWTRIGAAIITRCDNRGTTKETFTYWANSWFSNLP